MFSPLKESILGRAAKKGILDVEAIDIRAYSADKHGKCDDMPFGGGAGMVMTPQPIVDAVEAVDPAHTMRRIYLSPRGRTLNAALAASYSTAEGLLFLCGHYEGVDQRAIDLTMDEELSIGDYVLTGGELAAMVVVDAVSRFIPGVLSEGSAEEESFSEGLLEYPQYTRPQEFRGIKVPEVLLSGHHANIEVWRRQQAEALTKARRPDLLQTNGAGQSK